jgi:hypothetical protein
MKLWERNKFLASDFVKLPNRKVFEQLSILRLYKLEVQEIARVKFVVFLVKLKVLESQGVMHLGAWLVLFLYLETWKVSTLHDLSKDLELLIEKGLVHFKVESILSEDVGRDSVLVLGFDFHPHIVCKVELDVLDVLVGQHEGVQTLLDHYETFLVEYQLHIA